LVGVITENFPQPIDGFVETALEVEEYAFRPKSFPELLPGYKLTVSFQQEHESLKGLFREFQARAMFAQFPGRGVDLEYSEADFRARISFQANGSRLLIVSPVRPLPATSIVSAL
jgi:hypothetical protein